jgi:flagellar protein FliS
VKPEQETTMSTTELSYRRTAIEGASPIGLMIVLLDTLISNFRLAAGAIRQNDIETRCKELNHALLVIGRLESWIDLKNGGESATNLSAFYAYLRAKMMEASVKKSAEMLDAQIETVVHVRSAWQQLDVIVPEKPIEYAAVNVSSNEAQHTPAQYETSERVTLSLSA